MTERAKMVRKYGITRGEELMKEVVTMHAILREKGPQSSSDLVSLLFERAGAMRSSDALHMRMRNWPLSFWNRGGLWEACGHAPGEAPKPPEPASNGVAGPAEPAPGMKEPIRSWRDVPHVELFVAMQEILIARGPMKAPKLASRLRGRFGVSFDEKGVRNWTYRHGYAFKNLGRGLWSAVNAEPVALRSKKRRRSGEPHVPATRAVLPGTHTPAAPVVHRNWLQRIVAALFGL